MGEWAKSVLGVEKTDELGFIFAGGSSEEIEQKIKDCFDTIISVKERVYHNIIAKKKGKTHAVMTKVLGAPAMLDALTHVHDAGVKTIIMVGTCYGGVQQNLPIGSLTIPKKSIHYDGIEKAGTESFPDKELFTHLKEIFPEAKETTNISVPSVTFQPRHRTYIHGPATIEMEAASFFKRCKETGMRGATLLIVSDNRTQKISDEKKQQAKEKKPLLLKKILEHEPVLSGLPSTYDVHAYLADVIHEEGKENVYKQ